MRLSKNNKVLDSFPHQECEVNACSMWSGYSALGFTDNQPWHANVTPVIDSIYCCLIKHPSKQEHLLPH